MKTKRNIIKKIYPLIVCPFFLDGYSVVFLLPDRRIIFKDAKYELLLSICKECTGQNEIKQIIEIMAAAGIYKKSEIAYLIMKMLENYILVDIHEYYRLFHFVSANPMPYIKQLNNKKLLKMLQSESPLLLPVYLPTTSLEKIINKRVSTRNFTNFPISKRELLRLLWSIYGRIDRSSYFLENKIGLGTVPSGGALYPLQLRIILLKKIGAYKRGMYRISKGKIAYSKPLSKKELKLAFFGGGPFIVNASICVAIASNFNQTTQKYSNRGYRYAFLEAGHVAQNAYLWCSENNLGVVEICGFNDEKLSKYLGLDYPKEAVLTTLFVGKIQNE